MKGVLPMVSILCGILFFVPAGEVRAGEARAVLQNFDYRGVTLDDGSLRRQFDEARDYYLRIPNDDLLKGFRAALIVRLPARTSGGSTLPTGSMATGDRKYCRLAERFEYAD